MRYWVQVVIAGLFEVVWVIGLKHASSPIEWGVTLVAIFLSFYWMIEAGNHLPSRNGVRCVCRDWYYRGRCY